MHTTSCSLELQCQVEKLQNKDIVRAMREVWEVYNYPPRAHVNAASGFHLLPGDRSQSRANAGESHGRALPSQGFAEACVPKSWNDLHDLWQPANCI